MTRVLALTLAVWMTASLAVPAGADETVQYKPGAWHYKSIPCVDTTVVAVTPRLGNPGVKTFSKQDLI